MKSAYPAVWNILALCRVGIALMLFAAFAADAAQPRKGEAKTEPQAAKSTPETRADFSAAMESIRAGSYEDGIALLQKVAAKSENNPVPYINLALAYEKIGYDDRARESLERALKIEPENPVANNEYALLQRKAGKFAEARKTYERTLEKYPDFMMVHKNLGILCDLYLGDYECALKHYSIYSESMPDDTVVKNWIAGIIRK